MSGFQAGQDGQDGQDGICEIPIFEHARPETLLRGPGCFAVAVRRSRELSKQEAHWKWNGHGDGGGGGGVPGSFLAVANLSK
jgi:hypothetical protein